MILQRIKNVINKLGPGLLFASTAIGTSHLVLSTRAGAHHGLIFLWIIFFALILKYPFYAFAPRYTAATGKSLIHAYRKQGQWALGLFFFIICIEMFFVTGAIGAVSAGLLSISTGLQLPQWMLFGGLMLITMMILLFGKYKWLEIIIKWVSVILLITMLIIFVAVLFQGPIEAVDNFEAPKITEGAGLILLISMLGWMPNGMEGSTMLSVWIVENNKADKHKSSLKEVLLDFNVGYIMTAILAFIFLIIGAYVSYGSGNTLDGNTMQFSQKLINVFTQNLGSWSFALIALAAFGTIYGTLITVWDAMARCFVRSLLSFKGAEKSKTINPEKAYMIMVSVIGIGATLLFIFSRDSVIQMLEFATIISFILAPAIAILNWKAILSSEVSVDYKPSNWMNLLAGVGLLSMVAFASYYIYHIWF